MLTSERSAIIGLSLSGLPGYEIARRTGRSVDSVRAVLKGGDAQHARALARDVLAQAAVSYAELHKYAAVEAAKKGDARPAEWALERLGVVESDAKSGPQVAVQVGVWLPGLGSPPADVPPADVAPLPLPAIETTAEVD